MEQTISSSHASAVTKGSCLPVMPWIKVTPISLAQSISTATSDVYAASQLLHICKITIFAYQVWSRPTVAMQNNSPWPCSMCPIPQFRLVGVGISYIFVFPGHPKFWMPFQILHFEGAGPGCTRYSIILQPLNHRGLITCFVQWDRCDAKAKAFKTFCTYRLALLIVWTLCHTSKPKLTLWIMGEVWSTHQSHLGRQQTNSQQQRRITCQSLETHEWAQLRLSKEMPKWIQ